VSWSALTRLIAYASLTAASELLRRSSCVTSSPRREALTIDLIQKSGEQFGLREQDLKIRSNTKRSRSAAVAMYLVKQLTSASLPEIGRHSAANTTTRSSLDQQDRRAAPQRQDLNRRSTS